MPTMPRRPCPTVFSALGLSLTVLLAACGSSPKPPLLNSPKTSASAEPKKAPVAVATPVPVPSAQGPATAAASGTSTSTGASTNGSPASAIAAADDNDPAVIYFDSDVYTVKDEYQPLLEAHAKRLIANPKLRLRIDAHTDNNGPADYNLELARMRAQSVMKQLVALGVPPQQLQIVGHGKGRAAKGGKAQAANRRVELTYR
ncbi:OmpA family protein [Ideonella sp. BN130291]|uniref:OmpA family protein n=1 Tax=Ideonella sp. BN130291 TaxID=3112940 RepID=UPI002E25564B|nr:OmpA family protein [Ideonella sp. BN130291]